MNKDSEYLKQFFLQWFCSWYYSVDFS